MEKKELFIKISNIMQKNVPWIILFILIITFTCLSENFLTIRNITNILNQNAYIIIISMGVTFLMLSGAIDLSIGYQMSLNGVICAILLTQFKIPVGFVIVFALLFGAFLSLINMFLSNKLKLPLLLVTLATMTSYQGVAYQISQSRTINGLPDSFNFIGQGYIGFLSVPLIITLVLFIITSFVLNKTYFGRYVYALGGNVEAARLSGINVNRVKMYIAIIVGIFVGLAAIILVARVGSAHASTGPGTEFTALTGICLGGVSIFGGKGKLSGVLAGVLILALISNGMQLAGLGTYLQFVAKGIILLLAFGFDIFQKNRRQAVKTIRKEMYAKKNGN